MAKIENLTMEEITVTQAEVIFACIIVSNSQDVVFTATASDEKMSDNIWICDSGASGHNCMSMVGMFDI